MRSMASLNGVRNGGHVEAVWWRAVYVKLLTEIIRMRGEIVFEIELDVSYVLYGYNMCDNTIPYELSVYGSEVK